MKWYKIEDAFLTECGCFDWFISTKRCIHFNKFNASPNGML